MLAVPSDVWLSPTPTVALLKEDSGIGSCRGCAAVWRCKGGAGLLWDAGGVLAGGDHGKRAGSSTSGQEWRSSYDAETSGKGQSQQKQ